MIDDILYQNQDWKELLAAFATEVAKNDYSFSRPNVRYSDGDFMLPSLHSKQLNNIALIVDTSGSIDRDLLNIFGAELKDIAAELQATMTVLYVDVVLKGEQEFEAGDMIDLQPKGGGGTCFRPGFEHIKSTDLQPSCIIYFTDGYCSTFPDVEPDSPTLWATYGNRHFQPPFGEVIHIDR